MHLRLQLSALIQSSLEILQADLPQALGVKVREEGVDLVLLHGLEA
jgi:hypothetical protein